MHRLSVDRREQRLLGIFVRRMGYIQCKFGKVETPPCQADGCVIKVQNSLQ